MKNEIFFTGNCPDCQINHNKQVKMLLNRNDFLECPECNLQILIENNLASIFRHRGNNDFKFTETKFSYEKIFQEVDEISYGNSVLIIDKNHLKLYLKYLVEPQKLYSINKLIDSYIDAKFLEKPIKEYEYQSNHFQIEFDDESILEKLLKIDSKKDSNIQFSYRRLYNFLHHILAKYSKLDDSFLPEMGMSQIEFYLCKKHFSPRIRKMMESNRIFVKYAMKDMLLDLIEVIYLDKKLILSYDLQELKSIEEQMKNKNLI